MPSLGDRSGNGVYSTSGNETVLVVWDAVTGKEVLFLPAIGENFSCLAVGTGGFFAVGSSAGHCYMAQATGLPVELLPADAGDSDGTAAGYAGEMITGRTTNAQEGWGRSGK